MIIHHKDFQKAFKKLSSKVQDKTFLRLEILLEEPYHPLLNHHRLQGDWSHLHSINITGDYRLIFQYQDENLVLRDVGTHSQLYG